MARRLFVPVFCGVCFIAALLFLVYWKVTELPSFVTDNHGKPYYCEEFSGSNVFYFTVPVDDLFSSMKEELLRSGWILVTDDHKKGLAATFVQPSSPESISIFTPEYVEVKPQRPISCIIVFDTMFPLKQRS